MTFPQTNLPLHVEYLRDGTTWTDMVPLGHVRIRDLVQIRRGLSGEGQTPEPSSCALTIANPNGLYSPRKPDGGNYGRIGRNTQLRVSVDQATSYLSVDAETGNAPVGGATVSTPDTAVLDITGDIDLRWEGDLSTWSEQFELLGKWAQTGNQRSYRWTVQASGSTSLWWSTNGTAVGGSTSSVIPLSSGRIALRVTLAVATGTVTFYTSDTINGTWTVLGSPRSFGAVSIFAGTAPLTVGYNGDSDTGGAVVRGRVYAAQVRSGINGTVVANPDFTAQSHGVTSFADSTGKTWTLTGAVSLQKRDYRFWGEVPSWPVRWDISGRDVYVPLQAAGVMRRMGQGVSPLRSALYRSLVVSDSLVAYWPVEDGSGSNRVASGLDGSLGADMPMVVYGTTTSFASNSQFAGSEPIAEMNGTGFNGRIRNHVFSGAAGMQIRWIGKIASGTPSNTVIMRMFCRGTAYQWDLVYTGGGGGLALKSYDVDGGLLTNTGAIAFQVDNQLLRFSVELKTNGSGVDTTFGTMDVLSNAAGVWNQTFPLQTIGAPSSIQINPNRELTNSAIGHITYQNTISSLFDVRTQLNGYVGETAGRRFQRLCREESIPQFIEGDLDNTALMGVQRPLTVLDLLRECAFVDGGHMYEPRFMLGLGFRTREALHSQPASLQVPYGSLSDLEPVDDDQLVMNDVTATRPSGSSARVSLVTGALSTQDPPAGVGRYDSEIEVNVASDDLLPSQAAWRLHLGTVDEPRYPTIEIGQENPRVAGSATLLAQLVTVDIGDRMEVTGPPSWLPPETISQLVVGWSETMGPRTRSLALVCVPSSPYLVPRYALAATAANAPASAGRYSAIGSVLTGAQTTTSTSWSVTTPAAPVWTTDATQFPFDLMVEGEQVTVTAISSTSSPQTFTVVRSVNGIVKTHGAGAKINLFKPAYYG